MYIYQQHRNYLIVLSHCQISAKKISTKHNTVEGIMAPPEAVFSHRMLKMIVFIYFLFLIIIFIIRLLPLPPHPPVAVCPCPDGA